MGIFLTSTNKMTDKNQSNLDNLTKFAVDLESRIGVSQSEIIERFMLFYRTDFEEVCQIMTSHPIAKSLLTLASKHFFLVAATNPLFSFIANEKRLNMGRLDTALWIEITSAEDYHFAKPHVEFFEEVLTRINKEIFDRSTEQSRIERNRKQVLSRQSICADLFNWEKIKSFLYLIICFSISFDVCSSSFKNRVFTFIKL